MVEAAAARARRWASCFALTALVVAVAACGSDASEGDTATGGGGSVATEAFPVTVEHKYGETTLEARPERVVTVGLTDQDSVLALGVKPVGTTEWFGGHPSAVWPWAEDAMGDAEAEIVGSADALGFEKIAATAPDLILAVYAGITEDEYDKLSQIAPVVAQPKGHSDYGAPWQDQTRLIGKALGQAEKADEVVKEVEAKFAEAKAAHPEFEGATGMVAVPYQGTISVYAPDDVRGRFMTSLGFVQPPEIEELAGDDFSADLSEERVDLLDVDALVWIVNDVETDPPQFAAHPLYSNLAVHEEGHEVFVANLDELGGALTFQSVLSLPFLVDELVPKLAEAVKGTTGS